MKALILVDIQNDFTPGGALAVEQGDQVVPVANRLMPHFDLVVATQDWHPADHLSFASRHPGKQVGHVIELDRLPQVLWPDHCVEETPGAALADGLDRQRIDHIVRKGTNPAIDSYSGFFDNGHRQATGLGEYLKDRGVDEVYVCGLATDYCVKFTAIDAVDLGFSTHLILDGCRGVELKAGDVERALQTLREKGVCITESEQIISESDDR